MMRVALTEGLCDPAPAFVDSLYLQYMAQRGFTLLCVCVCVCVSGFNVRGYRSMLLLLTSLILFAKLHLQVSKNTKASTLSNTGDHF